MVVYTTSTSTGDVSKTGLLQDDDFLAVFVSGVSNTPRGWALESQTSKPGPTPICPSCKQYH